MFFTNLDFLCRKSNSKFDGFWCLLMNLVVFFQGEFCIGNSIVNFLISWQSENFLRKLRFLIDFVMEIIGFLLWSRKFMLLTENHSEHPHSWRTECCARKFRDLGNVRVYCMAFSHEYSADSFKILIAHRPLLINAWDFWVRSSCPVHDHIYICRGFKKLQ